VSPFRVLESGGDHKGCQFAAPERTRQAGHKRQGMKSRELRNFSCWQECNPGTVRKAPRLPGVYAFRLAAGAFGRFKGESDLVYIGCTENRDGTIRRRLRHHLPPRGDGSDIAARLRDAQEMGCIEVAWETLTDREEAKEEEARLLRHYYQEHLELPPLNRSEPRRAVRKAIEYLSERTPRELAERTVEHVVCEEGKKRIGPSNPQI
jgi:hypothetical protein